MLRRNFLRNAALTLPVALAAPDMLFAENKKNAKKASVIIIGAGNAGIYIAAQLAAANANVLLLEPGNGIAENAWHNFQQDDSSTHATRNQVDRSVLAAASFDKTKTYTGKQVVKINCTKKGFTLTDNLGNFYTADKIVFNTPVEFSKTKAMVHINTAASQKLSISIKRNDSTSAQCWATSATGINEQLLTAFTSSSKPAIMCIS
jgi:Pyridine nucleotide-disulphide oxidoreductase